MPQFDFYSFLQQVLLISVFICVFYPFYLKELIQKMSQTMKVRSKILNFFSFFIIKKSIKISSLLSDNLLKFYFK